MVERVGISGARRRDSSFTWSFRESQLRQSSLVDLDRVSWDGLKAAGLTNHFSSETGALLMHIKDFLCFGIASFLESSLGCSQTGILSGECHVSGEEGFRD